MGGHHVAGGGERGRCIRNTCTLPVRHTRFAGSAAALCAISLVVAIMVVPRLEPDLEAAVQQFTVLHPPHNNGTGATGSWEGFIDTRTGWGQKSTLILSVFNVTNAEAALINGSAVELYDVGKIMALRHRTLEFRDATGDIVRFAPKFWYELVPLEVCASSAAGGSKHGRTAAHSSDDWEPPCAMPTLSTDRLTAPYVPMLILFAHGFEPDSSVPGSLVTDAIARDTLAGRLLSGACDGERARECAVGSEPALAAVRTLRGMLARTRWMLAHTLELLSPSEWEVPGEGAAHPLAAGTAEADAALIAAFPALRTTHPSSVVMTSRARAAYSSRPGLGRSWTKELFTQRTAHTLLWGYEDAIFVALADLNSAFTSRYPGLLGNSTQGDWPESGGEKLAGLWSVRDGSADPYDVAARDVVEWRGGADIMCCSAGPCLPFDRINDPVAAPGWGTQAANRVRGSLHSDGFHANVQLTETLSGWHDRLARPISLVSDGILHKEGDEYERRMWCDLWGDADSSHPDIAFMRFTPAPADFETVEQQPLNAAFWAWGPTGLLNSTTCAPAKLPLFHSLPYFLYGNATALNAMANMPLPDPDLCDTWFDVEPITGRVLAAHDRWQTNVWLADMDAPNAEGVGGLWPKLRPLYLPLFWVDSVSVMGPACRDAFVAAVADKQRLAESLRIGAWVFMGFSAGMALLASAAGMRVAAKSSQVKAAASRATSMAAASLSSSLSLEMRVAHGGRWGVGRREGEALADPLLGSTGRSSSAEEDGASIRARRVGAGRGVPPSAASGAAPAAGEGLGAGADEPPVSRLLAMLETDLSALWTRAAPLR